MHEQLTEHVVDWRNAVVIERESRTIRNVALAGTDSKNGYRYAASALKDAARLYENVPVFLDHPTSAIRPRNRSARDLAGSVTNVRFESGRLRGDVRTLDTEAGRTLLALAEADGPGVGMSHVVLAEKSSDGTRVERIAEVISVDAVAFPATTTTFRESVASSSSEQERVQETRDADAGPSPPAPLPREKGVSLEGAPFVSEQPATLIVQQSSVTPRPSLERADGLTSAEQLDRAERTASSSAIESSAPSVRARLSGSLERVLASVDAELPGHLRRLAVATGRAGRGVRVGVFPKHVVLEWSAVGELPEHCVLRWRLEDAQVRFGDELLPLQDFQESLGTWSDVEPSARKESHPTTSNQIEQLQQRLLEAIAERDRLAARLDARGDGLAHCVERHRGPTSVARRRSPGRAVADELFVRTVRRQ